MKRNLLKEKNAKKMALQESSMRLSEQASEKERKEEERKEILKGSLAENFVDNRAITFGGIAKKREMHEAIAGRQMQLAEAIGEITANAVPLDEENKTALHEAIVGNCKHFVGKLFEDKTIKMHDLTKSKLETVRLFCEEVFTEAKEDTDKKASTNITKKVAENAKKTIKKEVEKTKELDKTVSSLKEGASKLSLRSSKAFMIPKFGSVSSSVIVNEQISTFKKLLRESVKNIINEESELEMERASGEAAIRLTLLETLNVIGLEFDVDHLISEMAK